jgi:hypothetical protein
MISRRGALICLFGMIAAPFVIRGAGVLMPVRNRLVFTESNLKLQSIAEGLPADSHGGAGVAAFDDKARR